METQNPWNLDLDPRKARGPWCKNLFPERQGFRVAQRGFTVGARIHSIPKRATLSASLQTRKPEIFKILQIRRGGMAEVM